MPKVDLDKITLVVSPLTNSVYAGVLSKSNNWVHKKDVTNQFLDCVIERWEGQREIIVSGNNKWKITVEKIK